MRREPVPVHNVATLRVAGDLADRTFDVPAAEQREDEERLTVLVELIDD
jgi:hypothetical protein